MTLSLRCFRRSGRPLTVELRVSAVRLQSGRPVPRLRQGLTMALQGSQARRLYWLASPCVSVGPVGLPRGFYILMRVMIAVGVTPLGSSASRAMLLVLVLIILPVSLLVSAGCSRSLYSSHSLRFIAVWPPLVSLDLILLVIVSLLFLLVGVIMGSAQLSGGPLLNTASTVTLSCALVPPVVRSAPSCTVFHSEVGAWLA